MAKVWTMRGWLMVPLHRDDLPAVLRALRAGRLGLSVGEWDRVRRVQERLEEVLAAYNQQHGDRPASQGGPPA